MYVIISNKTHRLGPPSLSDIVSNRLVGDVEAEAFINLTFTREVSETYRKLPLGVMRADFWR